MVWLKILRFGIIQLKMSWDYLKTPDFVAIKNQLELARPPIKSVQFCHHKHVWISIEVSFKTFPSVATIQAWYCQPSFGKYPVLLPTNAAGNLQSCPLKHRLLLPQTRLEMTQFPVKYIQFWSTQTRLVRSPTLIKNSQWCSAYKCRNAHFKKLEQHFSFRDYLYGGLL